MLRRRLASILATIPLGWCIREITKTAIFDWVTRGLEGAIGLEEAKVIAFASTYTIPLIAAAIIVGLVYWLGLRRGAHRGVGHEQLSALNRRGSRMIPVLMMALGGALFIAGAIWFGLTEGLPPNKPPQTPNESHGSKEPNKKEAPSQGALGFDTVRNWSVSFSIGSALGALPSRKRSWDIWFSLNVGSRTSLLLREG